MLSTDESADKTQDIKCYKVGYVRNSVDVIVVVELP